MAKRSTPSVTRPSGPSLPSGLSLIRSLSDFANVSSLHANRKVVLRIGIVGGLYGYIESITRLCGSASSEDLALPPQKASNRQNNTTDTTFGRRRRGVVEGITTGGGTLTNSQNDYVLLTTRRGAQR